MKTIIVVNFLKKPQSHFFCGDIAQFGGKNKQCRCVTTSASEQV